MSPTNFNAFLRKFSQIAQGLLLEIHPDSITAKSHTEDKAVIKYSSVPLSSVLSGPVKSMVKVGIHDIKKVINATKHFRDTDEIFLHVKYEEVSGDRIATELLFKSSSLKIKVLTADAHLFNYITPELLDKVKNAVVTERLEQFEFPKDGFLQVNGLCDIDSGKDFLSIYVDSGSVSIKSKSFEYTVCEVDSATNAEFTFYNEYFKFIEQENSEFTVGSSRMMVRSKDSDTLMVIGRVQ